MELKLSEKAYLSVKEAAAYFNIGEKKIRELTESDNCEFVLWVGNKRLVNRKGMEQFLHQQFC